MGKEQVGAEEDGGWDENMAIPYQGYHIAFVLEDYGDSAWPKTAKWAWQFLHVDTEDWRQPLFCKQNILILTLTSPGVS